MWDNSIIYWGEFNMKVTGPQAPSAYVDITASKSFDLMIDSCTLSLGNSVIVPKNTC